MHEQTDPALLVLLGCLIVGNGQAFAGGLWMYEQAASDMGMASAGRAASGLDASTAFGNPAAMTVLDRSQLVGGFMGINLTSKFHVDSTTNSGGDGGNAGYFTPSATFAYVHKVNDDLRLGIYSGSYFGLGLNYNNGWSGRYYVQNAEFLTACINPSIGYRLNDYVSVGGGVSAVWGKLYTRVAINPLLGGREDGGLKYNDTDIGYGYNLGVLVELSKQTRFGLTYRSAVDLDFSDKPDVNKEGWIINALPDVLKNLKIDTTIPQAVMFSVWHQLNPKLALAANLGWQDWSRFGKPDITVTGRQTRSLTAELKYRDTYHVALGAQYRLAPKWLASAGVAYDTSPIDKARNRSPSLPLDRQITLCHGPAV